MVRTSGPKYRQGSELIHMITPGNPISEALHQMPGILHSSALRNVSRITNVQLRHHCKTSCNTWRSPDDMDVIAVIEDIRFTPGINTCTLPIPDQYAVHSTLYTVIPYSGTVHRHSSCIKTQLKTLQDSLCTSHFIPPKSTHMPL